ncbi:uncharacterized protein JCM6883_007106 [Sporobolomyces salmoneus]|uniref:uncharacterized protein n=1 Tax=Sporobolomyces salmoneus TaxID=183962 RepID=UPI00316E2389
MGQLVDSPSPSTDSSSPLDSTSTSLLASLQPQPFQCLVSTLTISAPIPQWTIPMAIPITVPRSIQKKLQKGNESAVPKEIVRAVNLEVKAGEVLAIIGGSGSGKTTLLNAIADRAGNLDLSNGSISYSPLSSTSSSPSSTPASFKAKKVIGYVRQDDDLLPFLTVRETLTFSAALRLPRSVSPETRTQIVEQTITELGLADAADVIVGGAGRKGISGGEKRRLSIGCVLVTLPSILVLDEPTSGLDSFTAYHLLGTLSRLAKRGRCVVLSIHQPRSDAFPLFDKITLLSKGSVVYSGLRSDLLPHFEGLGLSPPKRTNPLDFVIDVSSIDNRDDEAERESQERVGKLVLAWREHERKTGQSSIWNPSPSSTSSSSSSSSPGTTSPVHGDAEKGTKRISSGTSGKIQFEGKDSKRANGLQQTILLTKRNLLNASRNYGMNVGLFLQAVIIGVGIGLCFLRLPETPSGIQSLKTVVYFFAPGFFYLSIVIAVFNLCQELVIFDREQDDNLYGTVPWVIALILGNLPANVIFPSLFAVILYFMAGLWEEHLARNVLSWIACAIMLQQSSWSYALLAASINRSFASASLLANGFSILFVLSSGYIITDLGVWISWSRWLSPYFYSFNWQIRLQFSGRQFACDGVTGPALNQCVGRNVLTGMRLNLNTPLYVFPLGLLGFIIVTYVWATLQLAYFKPGGVKHAAQVAPKERNSNGEEKGEKAKGGMDKTAQLASRKESVDVIVDDLQLVVSKRNLARKGEKEEKVILEKVNARFPAGQVSVIMGPSGAGKSSLLQMLAGRLSSGAMSDFSSTGTIKLNGKEYDSSLASLVAFVEQEDTHHLPALTVRETLRYAARLRLKNSSSAQCDSRAEEVLRMLGLKDCADNMVGGELVKGISGGEKRRLSLAVQLLSDPPVLLADEPLSGLDAFVARNVMQTLKDLATSGRTVIVSVHQPRSDIWQMFDNVLLLVKGGKSAYSGPTSGILEAFEDAGETCPVNFNPADFILDVVSVDHRSPEAEVESSKRVEKILTHWSKTENETTRAIERTSTPSKSAKLQNTSFLRAFPVVLGRSFKNLRRQQDIFVARIANPPFMALLFWLFFGRLSYGPSSAQDRVGLLQETTALPFVGMLSCIAIFPFERDLHFHEHKSSARHSVLTFLLAYTVQETIVSIISSFLFSVIFIWGMNMQSSARIFIEFWFSSYALISFGESIGIMFCAYFSNGGLAVSLVSAGITLLAQLNGVISASLMDWLKVIGWIAPMKPQAWLVAINEFVGLSFECDQASIESGRCIATTGEQILDVFSIPYNGSGKFLGILIALIVIWRIFAWIALRLRIAYL